MRMEMKRMIAVVAAVTAIAAAAVTTIVAGVTLGEEINTCRRTCD